MKIMSARDVAAYQRAHSLGKGEQSSLASVRFFLCPEQSIDSNEGIIVAVPAKRVEYQIKIRPVFAGNASTPSPEPEENQLAIGSLCDHIAIRRERLVSRKGECSCTG